MTSTGEILVDGSFAATDPSLTTYAEAIKVWGKDTDIL